MIYQFISGASVSINSKLFVFAHLDSPRSNSERLSIKKLINLRSVDWTAQQYALCLRSILSTKDQRPNDGEYGTTITTMTRPSPDVSAWQFRFLDGTWRQLASASAPWRFEDR